MLGLLNIFKYRRYKFWLWLSVPRFDNERSFHKLQTYLRFRFRVLCRRLVDQRWFDNVVLFFIGLNCITLAMERPNIPPDSGERLFLSTANYIFTAVFAVEMFIKVTKEFWYLCEKQREYLLRKRITICRRLLHLVCCTAPTLILLQDGILWTEFLWSFP